RLSSTHLTYSITPTSPTAIYTLSLHDALPISLVGGAGAQVDNAASVDQRRLHIERHDGHVRAEPYLRSDSCAARGDGRNQRLARSEEHTSELQSLAYLVCRLLLEKKKKNKNKK